MKQDILWAAIYGDKVVKVEVLSIEETYKKDEAKELYRVL